MWGLHTDLIQMKVKRHGDLEVTMIVGKRIEVLITVDLGILISSCWRLVHPLCWDRVGVLRGK